MRASATKSRARRTRAAGSGAEYKSSIQRSIVRQSRRERSNGKLNLRPRPGRFHQLPRTRKIRSTSQSRFQHPHSPTTLSKLAPTAGTSSNLQMSRACAAESPASTQHSAVSGKSGRVSLSKKWSLMDTQTATIAGSGNESAMHPRCYR
jgi:hypothetical protein